MVQSRPPVDKSDRNCKRSAVKKEKKHWQNGHGTATAGEKVLICSNLVYGDLRACLANWEKSSGEGLELSLLRAFMRVHLSSLLYYLRDWIVLVTVVLRKVNLNVGVHRITDTLHAIIV